MGRNKDINDLYPYLEAIGKPIDLKNKERNIINYLNIMFARTADIFRYTGIPEEVGNKDEFITNFEKMLQLGGYTFFKEVNGKYYCFNGGLSGIDEYYEPYQITIANPYLNLNGVYDFKDDKDGVLIWNDSAHSGLAYLNRKYASALAENDLSINIVDVMNRVQALIECGDDQTKQSAEAWVKRIFEGNYAVMSASNFIEKVRTLPIQHNSGDHKISELIELQQYLKASWFNDMGLNANYNMKRESLNSAESQMNDDALIPLVQNMFEKRKDGIERINKKYGLNISVTLNDVWLKRVEPDEPDEPDEPVELDKEEDKDV